MEMSSLALWLLSAGLATLSATAASSVRERVSARGRARSAARRARRCFIRQAPEQGLVRVVGRVELAGEPLFAPFSGRVCAHYEAAVEHPTRPGAYRRALVESRSQAFYVVDDSGRARVDVDRALVDVVVDHFWEAREVDAETRFELERFLYGTGQRGLSQLSESSLLRYAEGAIEPGELVSVVGVATFDRAAPSGSGYREAADARVTLHAPRRGPLFVSDGMHYS